MSRLGRVVRLALPFDEAMETIGIVGPTQRRAAKLRYLHGCTIQEIARRLRLPEGTVKSRLFHARKEIERALGPSGGTRSTSDESP